MQGGRSKGATRASWVRRQRQLAIREQGSAQSPARRSAGMRRTLEILENHVACSLGRIRVDLDVPLFLDLDRSVHTSRLRHAAHLPFGRMILCHEVQVRPVNTRRLSAGVAAALLPACAGPTRGLGAVAADPAGFACGRADISSVLLTDSTSRATEHTGEASEAFLQGGPTTSAALLARRARVGRPVLFRRRWREDGS